MIQAIKKQQDYKQTKIEDAMQYSRKNPELEFGCWHF